MRSNGAIPSVSAVGWPVRPRWAGIPVAISHPAGRTLNLLASQAATRLTNSQPAPSWLPSGPFLATRSSSRMGVPELQVPTNRTRTRRKGAVVIDVVRDVVNRRVIFTEYRP